MDRTVPVTMPEHVWGRLASVAADRGSTVAGLIGDAVTAISGLDESGADPVVLLARSGLSDRQIAAQLGITNAAVTRRRRASGVPANRSTRREFDRSLPARDGQKADNT